MINYSTVIISTPEILPATICANEWSPNYHLLHGTKNKIYNAINNSYSNQLDKIQYYINNIWLYHPLINQIDI